MSYPSQLIVCFHHQPPAALAGAYLYCRGRGWVRALCERKSAGLRCAFAALAGQRVEPVEDEDGSQVDVEMIWLYIWRRDQARWWQPDEFGSRHHLGTDVGVWVPSLGCYPTRHRGMVSEQQPRDEVCRSFGWVWSRGVLQRTMA
jgi:hypothetical protein